jgi:hypothetical protein
MHVTDDDLPAQPPHGTRLFLVRLWSETTRSSDEELCGRVQSVVTGEAHAFHGGDALVDVLARLLHRETCSIDDQSRFDTIRQTTSTGGGQR